MNQESLRTSAISLGRILGTLSGSDAEVAAFAQSIRHLIRKAESHLIAEPLEWRDVPGAYYFTEGTLRKYPELESAFATFRIELTGGENPLAVFRP